MYEAALLRNDVDALNALFWDDPDVLRFGVADEQHGYAELVAWRAGGAADQPDRQITGRAGSWRWRPASSPSTSRSPTTTATSAGSRRRGSGSTPAWRIARAHVSVIPPVTRPTQST